MMTTRGATAAYLHSTEHAEFVLTAKRALVVVLNEFVTAARRHRMVTLNHVFDALAARWSPTYRDVIEEGRASQVRDMRRETAIASRRDLVRSGVRLDAIWRFVVGRWSDAKGGRPDSAGASRRYSSIPWPAGVGSSTG